MSKSSNIVLSTPESESLCTLPVLSGTIRPDVLDVQSLYKQTGMFTYDPGFTSTASCRSSITYIDGEAGVLLYRGYPIEQLAEQCTFPEVCYLLLEGELPTFEQLKKFEHNITMHTMVHDQFTNFFKGFRRDAHPMAIMVGVVGALSAFYHNALDIRSKRDREMCAIQLKEFNIEAISGGSDAMCHVTIAVEDEHGKIFDASGSGDDIVLSSVEALVNAINLINRK